MHDLQIPFKKTSKTYKTYISPPHAVYCGLGGGLVVVLVVVGAVAVLVVVVVVGVGVRGAVVPVVQYGVAGMGPK